MSDSAYCYRCHSHPDRHGVCYCQARDAEEAESLAFWSEYQATEDRLTLEPPSVREEREQEWWLEQERRREREQIAATKIVWGDQ